MKNCTMCGPQPEENFYHYWARNGELYPYCKTCMKQRTAADQERRRALRRKQRLVVNEQYYKRSIEEGRRGDYANYRKAIWKTA